VVSNAAIEDFASLLRAGSHLVIVGAQHELLMEQDRFRSQFWAAFDAFVPGTPLY
jgi:lysophospholipase